MFHDDLSLFLANKVSQQFSYDNSHNLILSYRNVPKIYIQISIQLDQISTSNEQKKKKNSMATSASHGGFPRELSISLGFSVIFFPGMKA